MKILNNKTKILIATFSPWVGGKRLPINGNLEPLLDFFSPKVGKVALIDQVYPGSDFVMPRIEIYEKNKQVEIVSSSKWLYFLYPFLRLTNKPGTHISFKLRDFFSVIDFCLRDKSRYDFFIGFEAVNALAGILMRKFGFINKVIYYVSDYSPQRYPQKWFNDLYLWLDRFCSMRTDYIWDVSKAMHKARIKAGLNPKKSAPVIHVPNALYPNQITSLPGNKIKPYSLVFMGTLGVENGPDLAIAALPAILQKFPKTELHIIGGREDDINRLKSLARRLKIKGRITFHGFISDREEISKTIRYFYLALAPYRAIAGSPRWYGDATKIRAYLGAGLPVITTHVPPLGKEVTRKGAAIIARDDTEKLAEAVIKVFSDRRLYLSLRKKAKEFAKSNTWENEFTKAFEKIEGYKDDPKL